MGARQASGRPYTQEDVRLAVRELQDLGVVVTMRQRDGFQRLTAPFVLRRTMPQVLPELPAHSELVVAVAPEAVEAAHYEALRRQAVAQAAEALAEAPVVHRRA
jgi:SNF2 family DNA or RNA helicase